MQCSGTKHLRELACASKNTCHGQLGETVCKSQLDKHKMLTHACCCFFVSASTVKDDG